MAINKSRWEIYQIYSTQCESMKIIGISGSRMLSECYIQAACSNAARMRRGHPAILCEALLIRCTCRKMLCTCSANALQVMLCGLPRFGTLLLMTPRILKWAPKYCWFGPWAPKCPHNPRTTPLFERFKSACPLCVFKCRPGT